MYLHVDAAAAILFSLPFFPVDASSEIFAGLALKGNVSGGCYDGMEWRVIFGENRINVWSDATGRDERVNCIMVCLVTSVRVDLGEQGLVIGMLKLFGGVGSEMCSVIINEKLLLALSGERQNVILCRLANLLPLTKPLFLMNYDTILHIAVM